MNRIAIQGGTGSFHEQAARLFYGNHIEVLPCNTFEELFTSMNEGKAPGAVMAIENSIAGDLLPNYALLHKYKKQVKGEIILPIHQNLMALPGQRIEDITEVRSHYMAIAQTRECLKAYPSILLTESEDTAWSAKEIADKKLSRPGTIDYSYAAQLYHLEILRENIETNRQNYTRFLVLDDRIQVKETDINKVSLCFTLVNEPGSLARVLSSLSAGNLNVTKIQTLPITGKPWQYLFYLALEFKSRGQYQTTLQTVRPYLQEIYIMGEYKTYTI